MGHVPRNSFFFFKEQVQQAKYRAPANRVIAPSGEQLDSEDLNEPCPCHTRRLAEFFCSALCPTQHALGKTVEPEPCLLLPPAD